jgi:hypothetical protein
MACGRNTNRADGRRNCSTEVADEKPVNSMLTIKVPSW